ncbi:MAG: glutamate synthase (NADPH), homotetrameric [Candidatus Altiarchaeales archaeon ex4484_2]|nr:MAG: glutamate synthase (NADPH), homotetrameric [Candidatus Altiarchaeales archaeon ex4484_2]
MMDGVGEKTQVSKQNPGERVKNFREVSLGYSADEVLREASRCLSCSNPSCMEGCPVRVDIPGFIKHIKEKDFDKAADRLRESNIFPAVCGRVCPQESQCEIYCVLNKMGAEPVSVGGLERFVGDWLIKNRVDESPSPPLSTSGGVAVIGSGPAGLSCAAELIKNGYSVVVFESLHEPGGVLRYGIPEFRLPKSVVDSEIDYLKRLGVEFRLNVLVGRTVSFSDLRRDFDAIFIGSGAGLPYFLGLPGENLNGVYSANEFLTRVNLMKAYLFPEYDTPVRVGSKVAVVGGGNVAMDSARAALRLGAGEVHVVYRRSGGELPARQEEVVNARGEGVVFDYLTNPVEFLGDGEGNVSGLRCVRMELGEPDSSGRRSPVPVKGSDFVLDFDTVIIAVGQGPNPLLPSTIPDLEVSDRGNVKAGRDGRTSLERVYAGGDIVTGAATVISAMAAGKRAAQSIHEDLKT